MTLSKSAIQPNTASADLPPSSETNPKTVDRSAAAPDGRPQVTIVHKQVPAKHRLRAPVAKPLPFRAKFWAGPALFLSDVLAMQLALLLGFWVRWGLDAFGRVTEFKILTGGLRRGEYTALAVGMLLLPVVYGFQGLYPGYGLTAVERLRRRVYTVGLVFALLLAWDYAVLKADPSRGVLLLTFVFAAFLGPTLEAATRRGLRALGAWGMPVVVLGAAKTGEMVTRVLQREPELGFVPVALFDDDPNKWGTRIADVPVLGPLSCARKLSKTCRAALIAMPGMSSKKAAHLSHRLPFPRVISIPDLVGLSSLWVSSRDLGGIIGLEIKKNLFPRRNWMLKRTLDYLLGVPLFILSLPLMAVFALWIKIVSPDGPVLYRQPRVGFGGKTFGVWKLRTMYPDADQRLQHYLEQDPEKFEQWKRYCKLKDDPRILPGIGRLLRRTSLDELPQLWNVLVGEMSLVGPRPFPHYHLARFSPQFRTIRRSVLPGLTGLWQVSGRSESDVSVQEVMDTYYIRNWSPWLDIYLLSRTIGAVLLGRGAY
ncbi:MAG: sugar transferase [Phycisphaeraceae bacterium]